MKILFTQKMNGISGSELYLMQFMPELKKRGHHVEMLIIENNAGDKNNEFINYLHKQKITCHVIADHSALSPLLLIKINSLLKKGRYDVVQTNLVHTDMWFGLVKLLFNSNLKIVSVKHGYSESYSARHGYDIKYLKFGAFYWIQRFACKMADFNIAISHGLKNVYVNGGITTPAKISMVHYGLTLPKKPMPKLENEDPNYVLIIGRLIGFKGHIYMLKAWQIVKRSHPNVKLFIAGEGALKQQLIDWVKNSGLEEHITFLGHVANPHPLIANSLFTVITSIWEGFGLISLESWLHKKAIIAFDVPALNEIIDNDINGLLVPLKDVQQLAQKIIMLLNNNSTAVRFGETGYNKLTTYFTLQRMADQIEPILLNAANKL